MDRRTFLRRATASGMGMALGLGSGFWTRAFASTAQPGPSPYGPLRTEPDGHGLLLPEGFESRVIARSLQPVPGTSHPWHVWPDGGACFPTDDGGWVYVSNSENPPPVPVPFPPGLGDVLQQVGETGGVGAVRFSASGEVVDGYTIMTGSRSNCAGGVTPWGTWLSCEEWEAPTSLGGAYDAGRVWECDPFERTAVARPALGICMHEAAAIDPVRRQLYLSEDLGDGLLYRFTPDAWGPGCLESGRLEAMRVDEDGAVTWLEVPDPELQTGVPLRAQVPGATPFAGGEGCVYDSGRVYLTTKGDDRVWVHDVDAGTMGVLYDAAEFAEPVLDGVDNIIVSSAHDLYVAEDGGNMEVVIITPDLVVAPVVRIVDPTSTGYENGTEVPTSSEVTGLAFSPDGRRLYLNSQRGGVFGILYEVSGPWRGAGDGDAAPGRPADGPGARPDAPPVGRPVRPVEPEGARVAGDVLPVTGGGLDGALLGLGAAAAGLLAWRVRGDEPQTGERA